MPAIDPAPRPTRASSTARCRFRAVPQLWESSAVAIEMFVIFCIYWHTGFSWLARGYEYVLLWGLVAFAIALRGGGPYSLDRKIGVQL